MNLEPKQEAPGLAQARRRPTAKQNNRRFNKNNIMTKQEKELADNFAKLILTARERKGWTQAQLGQRMAETVNVIKSAESGKPPTDSVTKKFERVLGINLMELSGQIETSRVTKTTNRGMTLGDFLNNNGD